MLLYKQFCVFDPLKIIDISIEKNEILESYREMVKGIGRSLKKFPPAPESLLNIIRRNQRLPSINTAVDSYNIVASKTFLAFGAHDLLKLGKTIYFRLSEGGEPFKAVGSDNEKITQKGDFVYADENKVLAWLDSKDSDEVKLSEKTKEMVLIIQGTPSTTVEYRKGAIQEVCELITKFCGGSYDIKIIT